MSMNFKQLFLLASIMLLAGCASKESMQLVNSYAQQSVSLQESLLATYDEAETSRHNATLMKAVRDGSSINGLIPDKIKHTGHRATLSSLLTFSQAIHHLSADDFGENIDLQATKLNKSLISLSENTQLVMLEEKEVQLLSTSINALGRAYTQSARFNALKSIMRTAQPTVLGSITLLRKDLPAWKMTTKVSLQKELNIRIYLLNNPNRCAKKAKPTCVTFSHSLEERMQAYAKASQLKVQINQLDTQFKALDNALVAIKNLNVAVITSIESDNDVNIKAAKKLLQSNKEQLSAIKSFQKSIKE